MISAPSTEFGQIGSWALYSRHGVRHACRILSLGDEQGARTALISLADEPWVSTGQVTVPLASLQDPTPLDEAERAELARLNEHLEGLARPERSVKAARAEALQFRFASALWLVEELRRINRSRSLATRATREAQRYFESQLPADPALGAAA